MDKQRLDIVKPELLSREVIENKIVEVEMLLLEAIKNEFALPSFLEGLQKDEKDLTSKIQEIEDEQTKMQLWWQIRTIKLKIWELEWDFDKNQRNIGIYQDYIEYLKTLLS